MAVLGIEVHQQTGIQRMQVPLAEAYLTPAHTSLAGLSPISPVNSREALKPSLTVLPG